MKKGVRSAYKAMAKIISNLPETIRPYFFSGTQIKWVLISNYVSWMRKTMVCSNNTNFPN